MMLQLCNQSEDVVYLHPFSRLDFNSKLHFFSEGEGEEFAAVIASHISQ